MGLCLAVCPVCVTIFSTGSEFRPVSNFTKLHTLTLAARSYALLPDAKDPPPLTTGLQALKNFSMVANQN